MSGISLINPPPKRPATLVSRIVIGGFSIVQHFKGASHSVITMIIGVVDILTNGIPLPVGFNWVTTTLPMTSWRISVPIGVHTPMYWICGGSSIRITNSGMRVWI